MFSASTFSNIKNPFSSVFRQKLAEMAGVVGQLQALQSELSAIIMEKKLRQREGFFTAVITGSSPVGGDKPAWNYSFDEVTATDAVNATTDQSPGSSAEFENLKPRSGDAINLAESGNGGPGGTGVLFYGTDVSSGGPPWYLTTSPFTSSSILEVPTGTIVFMRSALTKNGTDYRYEFWAPNPVSPFCEA